MKIYFCPNENGGREGGTRVTGIRVTGIRPDYLIT
jgi:hypothetical protein